MTHSSLRQTTTRMENSGSHLPLTTHPGKTEVALTSLFTNLALPVRDYKALSSQAQRILAELPDSAIVERSLTVYFALFGQGFAHWQNSYDYHRVHEYFYSAYLQSLKLGKDKLTTKFKEFLEYFTLTFISYTYCENSIISNDAASLLKASTQGGHYSRLALEALDKDPLLHLQNPQLQPELVESLSRYLTIYHHQFQGLQVCAQIFEQSNQNRKNVNSDTLPLIKQSLDYLADNSWENFTELRSHYAFARRYAEIRQKWEAELYVKRATLLLRAIGYADEALVATLFNHCQSDNKHTIPNQIKNEIREATGLPKLDLYKNLIMDLVETTTGQRYLEEIIFKLPLEKEGLTFHLQDRAIQKEFRVNSFEARINRLGVVSVEFKIIIEKASVSTVRVLESLLSPYTGRFEFIWKDAPASPIEQESTIDYVELYLNYCSWLEQLDQKAPASSVSNIKQHLLHWKNLLGELSDNFSARLVPDASNTTRPDKDVYKALQQVFKELADERLKLLKDSQFTSSADLYNQDFLYISPDHHFVKLMDVAKNIVERLRQYLYSLNKSNPNPTRPELEKELFQFDEESGWQSILTLNRLGLVHSDGHESEPGIDPSYDGALEHPDFKGFIVQSREARASLSDWLFVKTSDARNLATIRSHETDALYVSENQAFLYLPDDPSYLVSQYVDSIRLVGDIRTLVINYNKKAKTLLESLEEFVATTQPNKAETGKSSKRSFKEVLSWSNLKKIAKTWLSELKRFKPKESLEKLIADWKKRRIDLKLAHEKLILMRSDIEAFRVRASEILDIIRSSAISKYQDHSELLVAMMEETRFETYLASLERKIAMLDQFYEYLTNSIKRQIDKQDQRNAKLIQWGVYLIGILQAVQYIPKLSQALSSFTGDYNKIRPMLIDIGLSCAIGAIICLIIIIQRKRHRL